MGHLGRASRFERLNFKTEAGERFKIYICIISLSLFLSLYPILSHTKTQVFILFRVDFLFFFYNYINPTCPYKILDYTKLSSEGWEPSGGNPPVGTLPASSVLFPGRTLESLEVQSILPFSLSVDV